MVRAAETDVREEDAVVLSYCSRLQEAAASGPAAVPVDLAVSVEDPAAVAAQAGDSSNKKDW